MQLDIGPTFQVTRVRCHAVPLIAVPNLSSFSLLEFSTSGVAVRPPGHPMGNASQVTEASERPLSVEPPALEVAECQPMEAAAQWPNKRASSRTERGFTSTPDRHLYSKLTSVKRTA